MTSRVSIGAFGRHIGGNYFAGINGLTAFWQIDYGPDEGQVIAWGRGGLAIPGCEPEGDSEFALVFDYEDNRVTRLLVIEDLPAFILGGGQLPEREAV